MENIAINSSPSRMNMHNQSSNMVIPEDPQEYEDEDIQNQHPEEDDTQVFGEEEKAKESSGEAEEEDDEYDLKFPDQYHGAASN